MPKTKVQTAEREVDGELRKQYSSTIPKGLAEAFEVEGKELRWSVGSGNKMEVEVVDE
jgi:hypothetical protein